MEEVIQIVGFLAFMLYTSYIDYTHIKQHDKIQNHTPRFMQRGVVIFFIASFNVDLWSLSHLQSFIGWALIFGSTFDTTLNLMRGKTIGYLGHTAKWDRFWRRHYVLYVTLIPLALVVGVWLLI